MLIYPSAVHPVDVVDGDRAAATEEDDENGETDRGLRSSAGENEHCHHLAGQITEVGRESDEVDVDREQDQLDRHQHQDDVAAVEEDAEHADGEQDRADREIMVEADHSFIPSPTPGSANFTASSGRRAICFQT